MTPLEERLLKLINVNEKNNSSPNEVDAAAKAAFRLLPEYIKEKSVKKDNTNNHKLVIDLLELQTKTNKLISEISSLRSQNTNIKWENESLKQQVGFYKKIAISLFMLICFFSFFLPMIYAASSSR